MKEIKSLYFKYQEQINYLFFGGCSFLVSMVSFWLLCKVCDKLIANIISWIITVLFAYWTNSKWVFGGKNRLGEFAAGRLFTLGVEELILWLSPFAPMLTKLVAQFLVIILNYVVSKYVVFRK